MTTTDPVDAGFMRRALELARRGEGWVEPNPLVGCVIVRDGTIVGEGWHPRFGGPHAEIEALRNAGSAARGSTLYVTLEPCCHHGKTPPCTEAILEAGIERVLAAQTDPFPRVAGGGFQWLEAAGVRTQVGLLQAEAEALNAPYRKLIRTGRPWVLAKWAMTLDGRIASRTGDSKWISQPASRAIVHRLRGRMDAIVVGLGTARADNPLLTARPPGPRQATRIVLDARAELPLDSQLVQSARDVPVLVVTGPTASVGARLALESAGCEVWSTPTGGSETRAGQWQELLDELGRRRWTNLLVEGGASVLGAAFDACEVDELHLFLAPLLLGGAQARSPVGGKGVALLANAARLEQPTFQLVEQDIYVSGRVRYPAQP
jgi:diaminohydroxyphosphoribosylaminopyrimidine deaminase/5-amino-6-(5-phosphoribosylamino)uracil reductase